ncbi:acyl-CoA dehydrogenase family protein [Epibacterium sp. Ofav1-8]|uniref:acyl-CoA dehydrogenase family protein n=1 Tax=Epibacterium sp. Ofav1-8 TaxID=2917735 RepID=UPI001EF7005C|nr:acyl-CoA dehydrogenase family protein [Epibacterium sp. Ofav1-8]MCG7625146.1 acyl-CoA dehydrogenase family protein [Epibacterium sp. Ofav1-8]
MTMFPRPLFNEDHEAFRAIVRRFCEKHVAPNHAQWAEDHIVPREIWQAAGALGMLNAWLPEEYGGVGDGILFDVIVNEELSRIGATGPGFSLHSLIVTPYVYHHGSDALKTRLLPKMVSGDAIAAIAMTEPSTGSDLAALKTSATQDGDGWLVNGQKTFITNGHNADVIVTACVTDPARGSKGISLLVIERGMEGFTRGRNLRKIGQHAQDTAELFFDNVHVPAENMLGQQNQGFKYMMQELVQERVMISVQCQARAEGVFRETLDYVSDRKAFGTRVIDFQNTRFTLADIKAQLMAGRAFCDQLMALHVEKKLDPVQAAAGKLWHSEMLGRVADACLQLHGGFGYMEEYPVARAYVDARIERIYAGTSEIMKEIIGRSLGQEAL